MLSEPVQELVRMWFAKQAADSSCAMNRPINPYVVATDKLPDRGVVYRTSRTADGDSQIIFTVDGETKWRAGRIQEIFTYKQTGDGEQFQQMFLVAREYVHLTPEHSAHDPYKNFPIAGGRLFYEKFTETLRLLTVDDIVSHFGAIPRLLPGTAVPVQCLHVLPLDKVSALLPLAQTGFFT